MKDKLESIAMPEYGVTDIVSRVTFIPTRYPHETPDEAIVRGTAQAHEAILELARMLGRKLARDVASGRITLDDDGNIVDVL